MVFCVKCYSVFYREMEIKEKGEELFFWKKRDREREKVRFVDMFWYFRLVGLDFGLLYICRVMLLSCLRFLSL